MPSRAGGLLLLPVTDRPVFARKMLAVWRLQHLAAGEDLAITIWPGEWPADHPHEVKGVEVREDTWIAGESRDGSGVVAVLGRVGDVWRLAYNMAVAVQADCTPADLAITTFYAEVNRDRELTLWMSPSPETGEVPMWTRGRRAT